MPPVDLSLREGAYSVRNFPDGIHPSPIGAHGIADDVIEAIAPEFDLK